ncbi:MAG TPA: c-type cytochrome [Rhizomicrobium sp.]|nr:c-type cytochrome [Rhizomicrobium sp.]
MKKMTAALLLLPFLQSVSFAQVPDPAAAKSLWESNNLFCKNCHGKTGEGAFGPDLAGRGLSAGQFQQAVRKPWGVMPTFIESQISDAEIAGLAAYFASLPKVSETGPWRVPTAAEMPHGQQVYVSEGCAQCHGATFDMPRASFGGRNVDFATMKDLVYSHTTAMPKFEEQRPGSRLRMGNFMTLRLSEGQLKEIFDWAHDDLGFRPDLQARLTPGTGTTYALNVVNNGEPGKGLVAQGVTIDLMIPAGVTVTAATGDGYKGFKANVAEWQVARLAPKDAQAFTVTLSQAPANPADLKGTIRWAKPSPKTGPNMDTVQFAMRPPGPGR